MLIDLLKVPCDGHVKHVDTHTQTHSRTHRHTHRHTALNSCATSSSDLALDHVLLMRSEAVNTPADAVKPSPHPIIISYYPQISS